MSVTDAQAQDSTTVTTANSRTQDSITLATDTTTILVVEGTQVRLASLKSRTADGWDFIAEGTDPQPVPLTPGGMSSGAHWQYRHVG